MKSIALIALFVAGAAANYGYSQPAVRIEPVAVSYGSSAPASYASAAPASYGSSYGASRVMIPITRFNHEIRGSDASTVEFESGNGIRQSDNTQVVQGRGGSYMDEYGKMVQSSASISKTGQFSYTSPEGQLINLNWVADENGFRATGDHLPTPPPIPAEIAASLRGASAYGSSYSAPVRSAAVY